jgi:hypothetical protein
VHLEDGIFGPTVAAYTWSAISSQTNPGYAWAVDFAAGRLVSYAKSVSTSVRAVRAGS